MSQAGVAGVPGNAFADSDQYDSFMRFCIAREDEVLQGALDKIQSALSEKGTSGVSRQEISIS